MIVANIEKTVSTLVGRLGAGDDRAKRLTANDIIGHFFIIQANAISCVCPFPFLRLCLGS
jgi:hypothetical protein